MASYYDKNFAENVKQKPRHILRPMARFEVTDDIVISGIAGRFPESDSMDEFADNLFKNIDMVVSDDRRWPTDLHNGSISRGGKLKELDKFDHSFFGILTFLADAVDPQSRIMLETTYEAICDAGVNPQTLRDTNTGVYVGINTVACSDGLPQDDYYDCLRKEGVYHLYGSSKTLYANRVSFLFDFNGPSYVVDTACSASLVALINAMNDIRHGICDQAVVATANLIQAPFTNFLFECANLVSSNGKCKVWDKKADGFVRAETVGALFLQKKSDAKRNYATVLHGKTNTDGYKAFGIFKPFWLSQRNLMIETLEEAGVNPNDVKYFEAHGTGTVVGDPQEAKAIADAYCSEQRAEPLLIGSVKSNMGHSEGSSGLNSLAKAIITFENQCIPANLNFDEPNPEIESIVNGTLVPVVKNTPFTHSIIGVNSFGIGGVNANVILKANNKELTAEMNKIADTVPRLVNVCGRTKESVKYIFDYIENNPNKANREFLALLTDVMKTQPISGSSNFPYRGYVIIKEKRNENSSSLQYDYTHTITTAKTKQSVWLAFTGMGSQWTAMAKTLMPLKTFSDSIQRSAHFLKPYNIDLLDLLLNDNENAINNSITNPFVAITSMQIALYDVICLLNLQIDGIIGHSFGEIACAYADGCLTQEQAVLCSYWRGNVVQNAKQNNTLPKGMLAAVGLSWKDIINRCPEGIVAACHNGSDSVTVSGLYDDVMKFIEQLCSENIFARKVSGGDFPYHSHHMKVVAPQLLQSLNGVIANPKQRSDKWMSTSVPPNEWNTDKDRYASGEYFTNNLISPVYFNEAMTRVANDSIVIEVAPHSLFESIFKKCFSNLIYTSLMKRTESDNLSYLLSSIGTLYTYGLNPDIENLYPPIEWPVSRGTQSISSLIKWDHESSSEVKKFPEYHNFSTASDYRIKISLFDTDWSFLKDHTIDGKVIFPATGYLTLVWRRMAAIRLQPWKKTPIAFNNVRFLRPTFLSEERSVKLTILILEKTGDFTISDGSFTVCTGKVCIPDEPILEMQDKLQSDINDDNNEHNGDISVILSPKEIYKELKIRGYDYGPQFKGLVEARGDGLRGKAKWTGHVISFMDSVLHLALLSLPIRTLFVPIGFQSIRIDPNTLFDAIETTKTNENENTGVVTVDDTTEQKEVYYLKESDETEPREPNQLLSSQLHILKSATGLDAECSKIIAAPFKRDDEVANALQNELSILPVVNDVNMKSIVTKGIEITGIIPMSVPRRATHKQLLLEKYEFIANNEQMAIEKVYKEELVEYIEVCCSLVERLSRITGKINKPVLNGYKCADESTVKRYLDSPKDNHKILSLLRNIIVTNGGLTDDNHNFRFEMNDTIDNELTIETEDMSGISFDLLKTTFTTERYIRPLLDIVIENSVDRKHIKVLELNSTNIILASSVINTMRKSGYGHISIDYCVATPSPSAFAEEIKSTDNGIKIIEWDIREQSVLKDISQLDLLIYRPNNELNKYSGIDDQLNAIRDAVKDNGFIIIMTRNLLTPPEVAINEIYSNNSNKEILFDKELDNFISTAERYGLKLICRKHDSLTSTLILLRKLNCKPIRETEIINIKTGKCEQWVNVLKEKIAENLKSIEPKSLWLVANDTPVNGIIGLINCLRLETGGEFMRCIFDCDSKLPLPLDFSNSPYYQVLEMDLQTNVYKDGKWGAFRHISLPEERETVMTEHSYLNIVTRGDLSSLKWFESRLKYSSSLMSAAEKNENQVLCNVYYSALNFRDVVLATGRIQPLPEMAILDCIIGLEYAGRISDSGKRVMGVIPTNAIATTVLSDRDFLMEVPDHWTLEDAATVPIVYLTVYYALIMRGGLQSGESVLIHSGAGGVGQAAINVCQSLDCEIFVTVGTQHKREFIQNKFNIDDTHIGNSRDTSFEKMVMRETKGKGVDIVLNSLAEDKLQASVRCLAINGRFLEIGKYDMQMNHSLGLFAFLRNISFHGICLEVIFANESNLASIKRNVLLRQMIKLLNSGIANNVVKPIERTVFAISECEQSFRHMTTGKHIGKVLIKIRDEESEKMIANPKPIVVNAYTKTWFHPLKVYVIIGGVGGFGLELAYWMALRGATKLVLTSRTGIKTEYQKWRLNGFKQIEKHVSDYRVEIKVLSINAKTIEGANQLIDEANRMGSVGGVFNLALVLRDGFIENQTVQAFNEVCAPKIDSLSHLDVVTQAKCPQIDYFVCFSSMASGRGGAGQSNYGYANSAMERLCEVRRNKGLHGLAIQFGPIGDVGVIAEHLLDTVYKKDTMKLLSGLILQRICSCLEVLDRYLQIPLPVLSTIEKQDIERSGETKTEDQLFKELCSQIDINNRSDDETLGDIGIESILAVEMQQRLEKDYDISLTVAQIRQLTVAEFKEFRDSNNKQNLKQYSDDIKRVKTYLFSIRWDIAHEESCFLNNHKIGKPIFMLPPVEGVFDNFKQLAAKINRPVIGINWTKQMSDVKDFKRLCAHYNQIIARHSQSDTGCDLIVHSFGALIAFYLLRKRQLKVNSIIFIDSMQIFTANQRDKCVDKFSLFFDYNRAYIPERMGNRMRKDVMETKGEEAKLSKVIEIMKEYAAKQLIGKDFNEIIRASFERADMIITYRNKITEKLSKHDRQTKRKINKMLKALKIDITFIQLLSKAEDLESVEQNIEQNYGFKKQHYTIHPIIGTEADFIAINLQRLADIINAKLG